MRFLRRPSDFGCQFGRIVEVRRELRPKTANEIYELRLNSAKMCSRARGGGLQSDWRHLASDSVSDSKCATEDPIDPRQRLHFNCVSHPQKTRGFFVAE